MSWLDYIFDSDHQQREDLLKHEDQIRYLKSSLRTQSHDLEVRVEKLADENAEIKLVCLTLMHTLINHDLITKESFIQLAQQIDAEESRQNGWYKEGILPKPEPPLKPEIKIDFSSARHKSESFNS